MNSREFYAAVINANISDELTEKAQSLLDAMDASNAKNRSRNAEKAAAKKAEKQPLRDALLNALTDEPQTATDLIAAAGLEGVIKFQAVPSLLKDAVEDGIVEKVDVKIVGKGTHRGYRKAAND